MISRTLLKIKMLPAVVRSRMARQLSGKVSSSNIRALVHSLSDENEAVRTASLESLVAGGASSAAALIAESLNESSVIRTRVASALSRFIALPQVVRALTGLLRDPSASVRATAANSLSEAGPLAVSAIGTLSRLAQQDEFDPALAAVKSLGRIDVKNFSSLPTLISLFGHNDRNLREAAIEAVSALCTLDTFQNVANDFLPQLLLLFSQRDSAIREAAARVCAAIGKSANAAIPELIQQSRDVSVGIRLASLNALVRISPGDPCTFPILIEMTQDKEWSVREIATYGFVAFGPAAKNAVPRLKSLLSDGHARVRRAAIKAMVAIGYSARYLSHDLYVRLFDKQEETRRDALLAFREMACWQQEFVPVLIHELQSKEVARRLVAIEVIRQFGDHAASAAPCLLDCLHDEAVVVRQAAAALTGQTVPLVSDR